MNQSRGRNETKRWKGVQPKKKYQKLGSLALNQLVICRIQSYNEGNKAFLKWHAKREPDRFEIPAKTRAKQHTTTSSKQVQKCWHQDLNTQPDANSNGV